MVRDESDDIEARRLRNIAENRRLLEELGLGAPIIPTAVRHTKAKAVPKPKAIRKSPVKRSAPSSGTESDGGDGETRRAPKAKRVKARRQSEPDEGPDGARRSSRQTGRRVSYANDGEDIARERAEKQALANNSSDYASESEYSDDDDEEDGEGSKKRKHKTASSREKQRDVKKLTELGKRIHDPKTYGAIPGVSIGTVFATRAEASLACIHGPWVAGISGDKENGAWSIALSGGYEDDVDLGDRFTYTGAGGRDLKGTPQNRKNLRTAPQSFDQSFEKPLNKCLQMSAKTGNPVRVLRGFKLDSPWAPATGYRYDGLYKVEKAWMARGLEGYMVCKYALVRMTGQEALTAREEEEEVPAKAGESGDDQEPVEEGKTANSESDEAQSNLATAVDGDDQD